MNKYQILLNILDNIRSEAPTGYKIYYPDASDYEALNQARSRAFIHLFFKVRFGLLDFLEREEYITDGISDAGIDGYYIKSDNKIIYFIQSKFRTTKENFETKSIQAEEILAMDISRILDGEESYDNGTRYNGKILELKRRISKIEDIGRYKYKVIILANIKKLTDAKIKILTGGFPTEIFDFESSYNTLVFPVISGTYYNESSLNININLSNKNAGSKISYSVDTELKKCEVTVLFVPTIEVARIMYKYKNSILKYNPRSYLEIEGKNVNNAIRETIEKRHTNEFALFNNGITMLSDETSLNERIGQKDRAQLTVTNPQIINGGQTAFTLSRIYAENSEEERQNLFGQKEVLLKIITFEESNSLQDEAKNKLIEDISRATNRQSSVSNADRRANEKDLIELQYILFQEYGIFLEIKRGEFSDGIISGYISSKNIIDRSLFTRIYVAAKGELNKTRQKKIFQKFSFKDIINDKSNLDLYFYGTLCYQELVVRKKIDPNERIDRLIKSYYVWIYIVSKFYRAKNVSQYEEKISLAVDEVEKEWDNFREHISKSKQNVAYQVADIDEYFKKVNKPDWVILQ